MHIFRCKQVNNFAVFHFGGNANVGMFAAAGNARNGFCLEGNFKAVQAENFFNDNARQKFVIGSLYAVAVFPVYFQLFHNVGHMAVVVNLPAHAAAFLMAHFRPEAVGFQHFHGLFQCGAHVAAAALPVLFLHHLRGA